jgi:magnesium-transporting ATPase (P-type)
MDDLVVGDIVTIESGDIVPADCLLIEEMDIEVDQELYYPSQLNSDTQA